MNRISKATRELLKIATLPARVCVGVFKAIAKETPESIQFPYEITKKGDNNGEPKERSTDSKRESQ
jgi:hypothetical protein